MRSPPYDNIGFSTEFSRVVRLFCTKLSPKRRFVDFIYQIPVRKHVLAHWNIGNIPVDLHRTVCTGSIYISRQGKFVFLKYSDKLFFFTFFRLAILSRIFKQKTKIIKNWASYYHFLVKRNDPLRTCTWKKTIRFRIPRIRVFSHLAANYSTTVITNFFFAIVSESLCRHHYNTPYLYVEFYPALDVV